MIQFDYDSGFSNIRGEAEWAQHELLILFNLYRESIQQGYYYVIRNWHLQTQELKFKTPSKKETDIKSNERR